MRVVCISDTHNQLHAVCVPDGDLLIHAGDATRRGNPHELAHFNAELGALPHRHKVVIAGNHDWLFERAPGMARSMMTNCTYLQDEEVVVDGVRIYGSPWQPTFFNWAFNLDRGADIKRMWDRIPDRIDILITHGPPLGVGDATPGGELVGCADLRASVNRVRPRLHVFGHIHHSYGATAADGILFANASVCNERYQPVNAPLVFDI